MIDVSMWFGIMIEACRCGAFKWKLVCNVLVKFFIANFVVL